MSILNQLWEIVLVSLALIFPGADNCSYDKVNLERLSSDTIYLQRQKCSARDGTLYGYDMVFLQRDGSDPEEIFDYSGFKNGIPINHREVFYIKKWHEQNIHIDILNKYDVYNKSHSLLGYDIKYYSD